MAEGSHIGRKSSWLTVTVMVAGFAIGGFGLVAGPMWVLFWAGAAVVAVGGVLALAVGIFSDVVMDEPRDITQTAGEAEPAEPAEPAESVEARESQESH